ncbi:MAG: class II aldolase/adducin family protein [Candidatus Zixiibacteriota bacterium]
MATEQELGQQIVQIGQRLAERQMVAGADGNISVRLPDNRVLITPSGKAKGHLVTAEIITVNLDGVKLTGKGSPSSESAMHMFVYKSRPDISACVHSHPPYVTSFAVAGEELPFDVLPEVVVTVGEIPLTEYAPPGTSAVPDAIAPFIADHNAFLLRNHGLLTIGRTLEEAYLRHETVEHYARILHLARQLGTVGRIPQEDFARLDELRLKLEQGSDR